MSCSFISVDFQLSLPASFLLFCRLLSIYCRYFLISCKFISFVLQVVFSLLQVIFYVLQVYFFCFAGIFPCVLDLYYFATFSAMSLKSIGHNTETIDSIYKTIAPLDSLTSKTYKAGIFELLSALFFDTF